MKTSKKSVPTIEAHNRTGSFSNVRKYRKTGPGQVTKVSASGRTQRDSFIAGELPSIYS